MDTHIMNHVFVPKFNPGNELHRNLAGLSMKAHGLAENVARGNDKKSNEEMRAVENKIDNLVAELFGISEQELEEMVTMLDILVGESGSKEEKEKTEE